MAAPCLAIFLAVLGATLLGQALAEPPALPEEM